MKLRSWAQFDHGEVGHGEVGRGEHGLGEAGHGEDGHGPGVTQHTRMGSSVAPSIMTSERLIARGIVRVESTSDDTSETASKPEVDQSSTLSARGRFGCGTPALRADLTDR